MQNTSIIYKKMCSIATQTDDRGCSNGCTSMYIATDELETWDNTQSSSYSFMGDVGDHDYSTRDSTCSPDQLDTLNTGTPSQSDSRHQQNRKKNTSTAILKDSERNMTTSHQASSDRPYKCSRCDSSFKYEKVLTNHQKIHEDFKCNICNIQFTQNSTLQRHLRTHTGEKPFKCLYCDKAFRRKDHLQAHPCIKQKPTSQNTGQINKPFQCSQCNLSFRSKSHLNAHQRIHNYSEEKPFVCRKCGKRFNQKGYLRKHRQTHSGEKPFKCSYCDKAFLRKDNLRVHLLLKHTKEKPSSQDNEQIHVVVHADND